MSLEYANFDFFSRVIQCKGSGKKQNYRNMMIVIIILFSTCTIISDTLESNDSSPLKSKLSPSKPSDPVKYMAGLYEFEDLFCSGFLVSAKHILTVAVCLKRFFTTPNPHFGIYHAKIEPLVLTAKNRRYYFEQVEMHKDYDLNKVKLADNIGLITLDMYDVHEFKSWISISSGELVMRCHRVLKAWGAYKRRKKGILKQLKSSKVKMITSFLSCLKEVFPLEIVRDKMLCSNNKIKEDKFTFDDHDLGAPLMDDVQSAVGILSFLPSPDDKKQVAIYIKLTPYAPWISNAMLRENDRDPTQGPYRIALPLCISDFE